jgi:hypothetical protein
MEQHRSKVDYMTLITITVTALLPIEYHKTIIIKNTV